MHHARDNLVIPRKQHPRIFLSISPLVASQGALSFGLLGSRRSGQLKIQLLSYSPPQPFPLNMSRPSLKLVSSGPDMHMAALGGRLGVSVELVGLLEQSLNYVCVLAHILILLDTNHRTIRSSLTALFRIAREIQNSLQHSQKILRSVNN